MRVAVWTVMLDQPAPVVARLARHLDADETAAATARRDVAVRDRYVVAHGAVREVLAEVTATAPGALRVERRCRHCGHPAHGKPELADAPDLSFSLAHSGSTAFVAVARGAQVGIDVEVIRARRNLERLARRVLTPDEYDEWRVVPRTARTIEFLRNWTAKEAYLKAVGLGIVRPLRTVSARPEGWSVWRPPADPALITAMAVEGELATPPALATWKPERGVSLGAAW
jgi:4'-phosphopantetheinyl transferase